MELLTKITIWYSVANGGDGSAYPLWFLTEKAAEDDQTSAYEGWGSLCTGSIETLKVLMYMKMLCQVRQRIRTNLLLQKMMTKTNI